MTTLRRLLMVLTLALGLVLAGCGDDDDNGNGTPAADVVQGDDTAAGTDDTTEPVDDTTEPVDDATTSLDDTTEPGDDTTEPVEDTTEPGDDTTEPVEPTPPAEGALGGLCHADDTCDEGECTELPGDYGKRCTQPCLSNYECPDELRCEAVSFEAMYCLFGARGEAGLGQACGEGLKGLGCASGICVDADPEEAIAVDTCTEPCESDDDCSSPFPICFGFVNLCLPVSSGDMGGLCPVDGACREGECTELEGTDSRCTRTCTDGEDCGAPYLSCQQVGSESYCLVTPAE